MNRHAVLNQRSEFLHKCTELLLGGAPGIHFYALNRAPATRAVLGSLRASRPWERASGGDALIEAD